MLQLLLLLLLLLRLLRLPLSQCQLQQVPCAEHLRCVNLLLLPAGAGPAALRRHALLLQ